VRYPIVPGVRIGALRTRSKHGVGLAAAVLALGLTGGVAATTSLALAAQDASDAALALRTASVRGALDTTFQRYADTLHDLAAVPPADAVGLSRIVGERLVGAHQALIVGADRRVLAEHAVDGSTPPAATRLHPEPELARAMDLAQRHGRLVASPAHVLPADVDLPPAHRQPAFEMVAPGHDGGWVIVSVRAADLLDASLRAAGVTGVAAVLTETSPDGVTTEVARWSQGGEARRDRQQRLDVPIAGHAWQILIRPTTPLVSAARSAAAPMTMLGAAVLSLAMAVMLLAARRTPKPLTAEPLTAEPLTAEPLTAEPLTAEPLTAGPLTTGPLTTGPLTAESSLAQSLLAAEDRASRAEARRRQQEDELAGFATTASEYLHAPLHTIAGFTELLLEDAAPRLDEESRGFLQRIDGATKRMVTLVDELMTYSGAGDAALKLEPVELSMVALDVAADHLQGATEPPSIEIGELPAVTADAALLRQVVDQLVDNAVRFVRHGAPARITIGARELPGGWWRIEVADRGIGVPQEQRTRIFAPFHRAPSAEGYPGAGLGLAVCTRLVGLHGGALGVDANPGGGSVFWFTVAAADLALLCA
jgi:signal transduction histidine kinase